MLIEINPINPQKRLITKVTDLLKKGSILAYPTDTMYGIGCNIMDKKAIKKIYQIKNYKRKTPLSFICHNLKDISKYAKISNYAYKIIRELLPGPYTFVLEGTKLVPKIMLSKQMSAGIRIPNNKICISLVKNLGNPIISTSAITTNNIPLTTATSIKKYFGKKIDIIIDGGPSKGEISSVISLIGDESEILREGSGKTDIFKN